MKRPAFLIPVALLFLAAGIAAFTLTPTQVSAFVPNDFTDTKILDLPNQYPVDLTFTPDGRMLIVTQFGKFHVVTGTNKTGATASILGTTTFTNVCAMEERGLVGVTIDPDFVNNNYVYVYYTRKVNTALACKNGTVAQSNAVNRLARFTLDNNTNLLTNETPILDNIPSTNGTHIAGDVKFGLDGLLYVTIGDNDCNTNPGFCGAALTGPSQRTDVILGKVLRINKDGTIPADNPFASNGVRCANPAGAETGPRCAEIFSMGLRNPFRMAFKPGTNNFYFIDVGEDTWEEINVGTKGANYGWPLCEGPNTFGTTNSCGTAYPTTTLPIFSYKHDAAGCTSIVGGAFVPPGVWPSEYDNRYFFEDYVCGDLYTLTVTNTKVDFGNVDLPISARFGPFDSTQALYRVQHTAGGQIWRTRYTGTANRSPVAQIGANPTSVQIGNQVTFSGAGSSDPDPGQTITAYVWNFGDGSPVVTTTAVTTTKTYNSAGVFTASLTVRDNLGAYSDPATIKILVGGSPPVPTISSPLTTTTFIVGQTITLTGSATSNGQPLPDSSLSWQVIRIHNTHTHPFYPPTTGNNLTFAAPSPESFDATEVSHLRVILTATDGNGISTVISRELYPQFVSMTLSTFPPGAALIANGTTITGPLTFNSWANYGLQMDAPDQTVNGDSLTFLRWSDGLAKSHTITTPLTSGSAFTATFAINGCDPQALLVVNGADNGKCGTLRYVLGLAAPGSTVTISTTGSINLTAPLTITGPLTLQSSACGDAATLPTLDGTQIAAPAQRYLRISNGVLLRNLRLFGFQLKADSGNRLECVRIQQP